MSLVKQQLAQNLYLTTGIQDPVVQQNFEKLNKIQADLMNGRRSFPSNSSYSEPQTFSFADNSAAFPVSLVAQLKTTGNPVQIQLAAAPYTVENITGSKFVLASVGGASGIITVGWQRVGNGGKAQLLTTYRIEVGTSSKTSLSLPAFGFDDEVPAGIWNYKFGVFTVVRIGGAAGNVTVNMTWARISLKELR